MNCASQSINKEHGQSMVEFALTITIIMVLLAGTMDLGRAFFAWIALRDAAQEGASYGSIKPNDIGGIDNVVMETFNDVITDVSANVVITPTLSGPPCAGSTPSTINVEVEYTNFQITTPLLGSIIGNEIPIRATVNDSVLMPKCSP